MSIGDLSYTRIAKTEKNDKKRDNYIPGFQYVVRIALLAFFLAYLIIMPDSPIISFNLVIVFCFGYLSSHCFLRRKMFSSGLVWRYIRLSIIVDLSFAYFVWIYDPCKPSPMMLFIVIAVVGNGIQYGLRAFKLLISSILIIAPFVYCLRSFYSDFSIPEFFLLFMCLAVLFYVYKFIFRIEKFRKETKERTRALEISKNKYRNIFENTAAGSLVIEKDLIISEANPKFEKMTGFSRAEIEGKLRWLDFVEKGNRNEMRREHIKRIMDGGSAPTEYEFKLVRKDGENIHVITEVNRDDKTGKAIASIIDISPRKRAEHALQDAHDELEKRVEERTAELKEINEQLKKAKDAADASGIAKSEFLANMSHEIRTPMNAIIGMCDLVMNTAMSRKQREYINIVRSSSRSLLELINDILDFSKIDAGKLDFENVPFNLREVIEEISDMFLEKSMTKELELIVDIDNTVPANLISDPLRLRQVLANLTSNAFKFTQRGEICISVKTLDIVGDKVKLLYCVKDTGIGIDLGASDKLFDAFAQADGSTTRKYGGTGLGLAICKKIVKMMGGDIWVESEIAKGSVFYFTTETKTAIDDTSGCQVLPANLNNKKVLIVDDNPSTLMIVKRYLESFGFRTEMANSGESALQSYNRSFSRELYDLILMDIRLPGIDGIKAISEIKNDMRITPPPIICMSAYGRDDEIQRAKEAGADSFLMKPVKQSILFDTIMEIFGFRLPNSVGEAPGLITSGEFSDLNLLLVEDNPINQMVATEVLMSADICVDKVDNGLKAIDAVRRKQYDAVLMDVQMPEMDGLESTRYIRKHLNMQALPIIAMTAHAMYGDRERCLAAGMNDYVPKPIDRKELFAALRKNITRIGDEFSFNTQVEHQSAESIQKEVYTLPGLDIEAGLERLGGNWDSYLNIVSEFCNTFKNFFIEFTDLIEQGNYNDARLMAHSLKGASGNIAAMDLKAVAGILEMACFDGENESILKLVTVVEDAFARVVDSMGKMGFKKDVTVHVVDKGGTIKPERLFALFHELSKGLEESDPVRSESCFNEIKQGISFDGVNSEFENLGLILERQVVDYNYDDASVTLNIMDRKLKKQLGF